MTDEFPVDKPGQQNSDIPKPTQFLLEIWLFLKRDIRSFYSRPNKNIQAIEYKADEPVASLVAPERLSYFIFQRKILDWRDHAHANITRTGRELQRQLDDLVNQKLSEFGLFDQFFPDLARDVLQNELRHTAGEISKESRNIEHDINEINATSGSGMAQYFYVDAAYQKLVFDLQMNFIPSNQKLIIDTIDKALSGPDGIITDIRDQVTQIAIQFTLIENEA